MLHTQHPNLIEDVSAATVLAGVIQNPRNGPQSEKREDQPAQVQHMVG